MELELRDIIHIIWKRFWIIVTMTLIAALVSGIVSVFFLDKIYETSTTLIVSKQQSGSSQKNELTYNDVLLNQKLVKSYSIIARSDRVVEQVIRDLGLSMSIGELKSKISVNSEQDTEIIRIVISDQDPRLAQDIANSLAKIFIEEVKTILLMDNVQIIDPAKLPMSPVKPRPMMNIAIAAMVGLMAALGIIFLIEYLDNTVKNPEDIERQFQLPVIGAIPNFNE